MATKLSADYKCGALAITAEMNLDIDIIKMSEVWAQQQFTQRLLQKFVALSLMLAQLKAQL
jgi:hypothetical protein